jgi:hypothetical protein
MGGYAAYKGYRGAYRVLVWKHDGKRPPGRLGVEKSIILTLSDPMSDLVRHYDFPVPDDFLDL